MQIKSIQNHELGHKPIKKLLIKYSTPAIIAMMFNSLYNLVDTIFVGQGAGTIAIAGLAISFPIQMLIMAIAQTVGIGSASIISRSLGKGDVKKAERTAGTSFATVSVLSITFTILGLIFLNPLLILFGATETILPYAREYMSVILLGSFFFAFAVSTNNLVRAEGSAKTAMKSMVIGAVSNIILDPIFIFGFKMGIRGAALATVLAQIGSFIYLVKFFVSSKSTFKIKREDIRLDFKLLPEIFAIGASSFARTVAGSIFSIIVNNSLSYYGTDLHIAIYGVSNRLLMFLMMPLIGLVQGLQPIVGFNYGAENPKRVKESLKIAIFAATTFALFSFAILMIFTRPLVSIFNNDRALITQGVPIIRTMSIFIPVIGFQMIGASLFQAIGKAMPALILSMSRQILFLIPLILILPLFFGLYGIYYAFPVSDLLSTAVTAFWVFREIKLINYQIAIKKAC